MAKTVPVGVEHYKKIVGEDYYYVDKTLLVKDILDSGAKVNLFTRPRRFGKTLAMSMLQTFFEDERDAEGKRIDNSHYFTGKNISSCGEKYLSKQGNYPVINLTLKEVGQPDFEQAYAKLKGIIAAEFDRHSYVLSGEALSETEKKEFRAILSKEAEESDYSGALFFLSRCLKKYHGSNVVVLIDEYDVPLEKAYFGKFYDRMVSFIRSLFGAALKTNDALQFAVLTGCLRISKESIFTGLNNLKVISVLDRNYAEYFGFTQEEVRAMLAVYGMENQLEKVKEWYDGYLFGETEIYNPWSIIRFVDDNQNTSGSIPKPYWANTSSNSIVRELIERAERNTRAEIESLLRGETIEKMVHEDITYEDIFESQDNLWNFLLFTGYLKKVAECFDGERIYLRLAIPNWEVRYIYRETILTWFDRKVRAMDRTEFFRALVAGDCPVVEAVLKDLLSKSISYHDTMEQFYHGFMVGVLSGLGGYELRSNRETGDGRADIVMFPDDEQRAVVILELKRADKFTQMDTLCEAALCQIEEQRYDAEAKEEGYTRFVKYGICFCKKSCRVRAVVE